jgi:hypothetical protein
MKNSLLFSLLISLLTFSALAREGTEHASKARDKGPAQTVEGCLSKTANTYVITGGERPKQYRIIDGDVSNLRGKLGHTVLVTGKLGQSDGIEGVAPPFNEGSTTGVTYSTIVIESSRDVSSNCSYPGFGK